MMDGFTDQCADSPPVRARIRRWYVANAVYFVTCVTYQRQPIFASAECVLLWRTTLRAVQRLHPFQMQAYVFLPDHLHLLIRLQEGTQISRLMQSAQWNYTRNHKRFYGITSSVRLWQRGFWDHVIRDEQDWEHHLNYIHYNPVKHGYVSEPGEYEHSSYNEYAKRGWYGHTPLRPDSLDTGYFFEPEDSE